MGVWEQLEEKWRTSPQIVVLVFLCAAVVVTVGAFAAFSLRKKKLISSHSEQPVSGGVNDPTAVPCCCMVKPNLRSSILSSWRLNAEEEQKCTEAMPAREGGGSPAASPVWQRRILMGERCEMPRYSGLILYDERGRPVGSCNPYHPFYAKQGRKGALSSPAKTTLRDLL